jgi:ubiquinone/menaquinone biosynthesis C-methylase UbiE
MKRPLLYLLLFLAIVLAILWYDRTRATGKEGFQQSERFILKTDEDSYDDFYSETYDQLMLPEECVKYMADMVLNTLQPDVGYSVFLDVGTGTGSFVNEWKKRGFRAYGIDQSQAMIDVALHKYPDLEIKCDSAVNPMAFDRALFTHIFCVDYTIYEIEDKTRFFNNCYFWLQNNGYLILHLVEKEGFKRVIPAAYDPVLADTPVLKTTIDFGDFEYFAEYVPFSENRMVFKESFRDRESQNIRQNERTLYLDPIETILGIARQAGFIVKGGLEDGKGKKWVIFERLN